MCNIENLIETLKDKKNDLSIFACYYQNKFLLNKFTGKIFEYDRKKFLEGVNENKHVKETCEYYTNILKIKNIDIQLKKLQNTNTNGKLRASDLSIDLIIEKILPFFFIPLTNRLDGFFIKGTIVKHFPNVKHYKRASFRYIISKNVQRIKFGKNMNENRIKKTLECLPNLKDVSFIKNPHITDKTLEHLKGVKKVDISYTSHYSNKSPISDNGFKNFVGIQELKMRFCKQENITDKAFGYLKSIKKLDMTDCDQDTITDEAFVNLQGIHTLNISFCTQLSSKIFENLKGIHTLDAAFMKNIDNKDFKYLKGIQHSNMFGIEDLSDLGLQYLNGIKMLNIKIPTVTDNGLKHLRGIYSLSISKNTQITNAGFKHLKGIYNLMIFELESITDDAFKNLRGIRMLTLSKCKKLTAKLFEYLQSNVKIEYLNIEKTGIDKEEVIQILGYIPSHFEYDKEEEDEDEW